MQRHVAKSLVESYKTPGTATISFSAFFTFSLGGIILALRFPMKKARLLEKNMLATRKIHMRAVRT